MSYVMDLVVSLIQRTKYPDCTLGHSGGALTPGAIWSDSGTLWLCQDCCNFAGVSLGFVQTLE